MEKLEIGDNVEIVEYGNIVALNDEAEVTCKDNMPHLIGQKGVVLFYRCGKYTLSGIVGKSFPFYRDQLKKI